MYMYMYTTAHCLQIQTSMVTKATSFTLSNFDKFPLMASENLSSIAIYYQKKSFKIINNIIRTVNVHPHACTCTCTI